MPTPDDVKQMILDAHRRIIEENAFEIPTADRVAKMKGDTKASIEKMLSKVTTMPFTVSTDATTVEDIENGLIRIVISSPDPLLRDLIPLS